MSSAVGTLFRRPHQHLLLLLEGHLTMYDAPVTEFLPVLLLAVNRRCGDAFHSAAQAQADTHADRGSHLRSYRHPAILVGHE